VLASGLDRATERPARPCVGELLIRNVAALVRVPVPRPKRGEGRLSAHMLVAFARYSRDQAFTVLRATAGS
jgi:hypothetical protein